MGNVPWLTSYSPCYLHTLYTRSSSNYLQCYQTYNILKNRPKKDQFRYTKIQPKTTDFSTRLWGITTEFLVFIPPKSRPEVYCLELNYWSIDICLPGKCSWRDQCIFQLYRAYAFTCMAAMQIYWNKRTFLHKESVELPQDLFGSPTWPPSHCFGTPIWLPWRHVHTLDLKSFKRNRNCKTSDKRSSKVDIWRITYHIWHMAPFIVALEFQISLPIPAFLM